VKDDGRSQTSPEAHVAGWNPIALPGLGGPTRCPTRIPRVGAGRPASFSSANLCTPTTGPKTSRWHTLRVCFGIYDSRSVLKTLATSRARPPVRDPVATSRAIDHYSATRSSDPPIITLPHLGCALHGDRPICRRGPRLLDLLTHRSSTPGYGSTRTSPCSPGPSFRKPAMANVFDDRLEFFVSKRPPFLPRRASRWTG